GRDFRRNRLAAGPVGVAPLIGRARGQAMDSAQKPSAASGAEPGITSGVSGVLRNLFGLLSNRIELAALELSEIRAQVLILLSVGALGMLFVWFALIYLSIVVAILAWPVLGWKILLLLTLFFALGAL